MSYGETDLQKYNCFKRYEIYHKFVWANVGAYVCFSEQG